MKKLISGLFLLSCLTLTSQESETNCEHYFRENRVVTFHYFQPGQASARLEFLGQLPNDPFVQENKERFTQETRFAEDGTAYEVFFLEALLSSTSSSLCEYCQTQKMHFDESQNRWLPAHLTHGNGRAFATETNPEKIAIASCKELLQNKKCVIVIGTALAEQAGVLTRSHFAERIGLNKTTAADSLVSRFLSDPESILQEYIDRTEKGLFGEPTPLIRDLETLATHLEAPIFTSNFDRLIQKTGVPVINVLGGRTEAINEILENANLVLTIGLNRDPEGILAHFKSVNPAGLIVAIDLKQPTYLGDEDLLVSMDLTEAIPELAKN